MTTNNKSPLISIIVPVYNVEKYLEPCISSLLNQTYKNIEIILINDGSTDKTEKILLDNNIPHIKLVNNLGIGGAAQTGYKYAYENTSLKGNFRVCGSCML